MSELEARANGTDFEGTSVVRSLVIRLIVVGVGLAATAAKAETLADAIALAYQSNPSLQQARAQLRELDEGYVQARAGYRPTLQGQFQATYNQTPQILSGLAFSQTTNAAGATISLNQPVYTGGRTAADIHAAMADVQGGRQALRVVEAQILQKVIQAYEDVRRDEQVLEIRQTEVHTFQDHFDDAQLRFKAGEITRTDVEQSQSQLETARSELALASGQLQISRSNYTAVVGQNPGTLEPEPPLAGLPATIDEAFDIAEQNSPGLLEAEEAERASGFRVARARAEEFPTVALSAQYGFNSPIVPFQVGPDEGIVTAGVTVSVPIFTGGVTASKIRQAGEANNVDRIGIELARRTMVQSVSQAWNQIISNRASTMTGKGAVDSAQRYLADTLEEYRIGQRSTLDVVFSEQTLTGAQIALVGAEHDTYVAEADLLAALGRLDADDLLASPPLYDPKASFRKVHNADATPWVAPVAVLDSVVAPGRGPIRPLKAPPIDASPVSAPAPPLSIDDILSMSDPTTPLPQTTSPRTPTSLGRDVGAPYTSAGGRTP